ncbi:MAG: hypothetical protein AAFX52_04280 [Pseudomonadota bacterium]
MVLSLGDKFLEKQYTKSASIVAERPKGTRLKALLLAASVGAIAVATPLPVLAQSLPSGCKDDVITGTPNNADNEFDDGETITCLAPPTPISPITTTANDLTIVVGDTNTPTTVSGGSAGIRMTANSGASVRVNNAASSVSGSTYGIAISAGNSRLGNDDVNIDVAGTVVGGTYGVRTGNLSYGDTTIKVADVTGTSSVGVGASHYFNAGDLSVTTTGNVAGGTFGMAVFHSGSGNTYVRSGAALGTPDTSTTITGTSRDGVYAYNTAGSGSLTLATYSNIVSTGVYNAANGSTLAQRTADGIDANHAGSGALTIGTGNVSSTYGLGIRADVSAVGTNLSITSTGTVSGGTGGIGAVNNGTGTVTVNVVGVSASGDDEEAIYAFGASTTTGMNITATGTVSATGAETAAAGSPHGIFANHDGSNALMIDTAAVSSANAIGIYADVSSAGTNLSITSTGTVAGSVAGIVGRNYGSGNLTLMTAAVTGTGSPSYGIIAYNGPTGQNVSITSTGTVSGASQGLNLTQSGTGTTMISLADVTANTGNGVFANNTSTAADLTIASTGTVTANRIGIYGDHDGSGALTINANNATGTIGQGILADVSTAGTNLSVTSTGTVSGGSSGIEARNYGTGTVTVNAAAVSASADDEEAIYAFGASTTTGMNITATGTVSATGAETAATGSPDGIFANHDGSNALMINTAAVSSTNGVGIRANNSSAGTNLSITSTGTVSGTTNGIDARNYGTGTATLNVASVTASSGAAINSYNSSTGTDMRVTATGLVSGGFGLSATQVGTGSLVVNTASVNATSGSGILANTLANATGGLDLVSTGPVTAANTGVLAIHSGTGDVSVNVADVTGNNGIGVDVNGGSNSGALSITSVGTVTGTAVGISAYSTGSGTVTVNAVDVSASGADGEGIYAFGASTTTGMNITATGTVSATGAETAATGSPDGIFADHDGSNALTINTAAVSSTNARGIDANVSSAGTNLSVTSTGLVTGTSGLFVFNYGSGSTTVSTGAVTGTSGSGIYGRTDGQNLKITSTGLVQGTTGIIARNYGSGYTTISTAAVTGGIDAISASSTTNLSITSTGEMTGSEGIEADFYGTGTLSINVAGVSASGADVIGILAASGSNTTGSNITVNGNISSTGAETTIEDNTPDAIYGEHNGSGSLQIDTYGTVSSTNGNGIVATVASPGQNLSISATNTVTAGLSGIDARNNGTGTTTLNVAGVSASGPDRQAIYAYGASTTTGMNITATGAVMATGAETAATGSPHGIYANHDGSNALTINTAAVSSTNAIGIYANVSSAGTDLLITSTGTVSGGSSALIARNYGSGNLTLKTAAVTGIGSSSYGITAYNGTTAQNVNLTSTGTISSTNTALSVNQFGTGTTMLSVVDVTSTNGSGIFANNRSTAADLTVASTGTVSGNTIGIYGDHDGSGALTINTNNVTSTNARGILATNTSAGTNLAITSTGMVTGGTGGIEARNNGTGTTTVNVAAVSASGADEEAIYVFGTGTTTVMTITSTGTVSSTGAETGATGSPDGIFANHDGSNVLTINTAAVSSTNATGIFADVSTAGTNLSITSTGMVSGGTRGIEARNNGTGTTTVNVAGATGGSGYGVYVYGGPNSGAMSITSTGSVSGTDGMRLSSAAAADVTVSGAVNGTSGYGINFLSSPSTRVTLNNGASVSGSSGAFSFASMSNDTVILNTGASISGAFSLSDGNDTFNDAGGTFATADGGAGVDTWHLSGSGRTENAAAVSNFENLQVSMTGGRLVGDFAGFTSAAFIGGSNELAGNLLTSTTTINAGASVSTADGASFGGDLINNGSLTLIGKVSAGSLTQSSTGSFTVNPNDSVVDLLTVSGPVTLGGTLNATFDLQPGTAIGTTETLTVIDGNAGVTGSFDTTNIGASGLLISRAVVIDQANSDVNIELTTNPITTLTTLNEDQFAAGDTLLGLLANPNLSNAMVKFINDIGVQTTEGAIASVLHELNPEGFDAGLRFSTSAQQNLFTTMMDVHEPSGANGETKFASLNAVSVLGAAEGDPAWWTSATFRSLEQDGSSDDFGFDGTEFGFSAGLSGIKFGPLSFGLAGGYSSFEADTQDQLSDDIDSDLYQFAMSAHYPVDTSFVQGELEGVVGYATAKNTLAMSVLNPGAAGPSRQTGDADMQSLSVLTRFTLSGVGQAEWPIKPLVEFGATTLSQDEATIGSGEVTSLVVDDTDLTFTQIGLGASFGFPLGRHLSWDGSLGATQFFGDTETLYRSRFFDAPSTSASFVTGGGSLEQQFDIEAGITYEFWGGAELTANAVGQFGDLESYGARVSLSRRF